MLKLTKSYCWFEFVIIYIKQSWHSRSWPTTFNYLSEASFVVLSALHSTFKLVFSSCNFFTNDPKLSAFNPTKATCSKIDLWFLFNKFSSTFRQYISCWRAFLWSTRRSQHLYLEVIKHIETCHNFIQTTSFYWFFNNKGPTLSLQ